VAPMSIFSRFNAFMDSENSLRGQLLRGGLGNIVLKLVSVLLAFLLSVLLARILGPKELGIYSFAYALIMIVAIPAQMGLPQLVVRETAITHTQKKWSQMRGLWRWSSMTACGFSLLSIFSVLLVMYITRVDFSSQRGATILWALPLIPLVALGNLRGSALKGLRHVVLGQLPETMLRPGLFVALIVLVQQLSTAKNMTTTTVMSLHICSSLIAFIFGAYLLFRLRPKEIINHRFFDCKYKYWTMAAFPLALVSGLQFIIRYTDILMLGVLGSNEEVGIYRIAVQVSLFASFGVQILSSLVAPYAASFYAKKDKIKLQKVIRISAVLGFLSVLSLTLIFTVFGKIFLSVFFGPAFQSSYYPLLILSGGLVLNAGLGPVGMLLQMTGYEKDTLIGVGTAATLNIVANFVLIPIYGSNGAAISTAISLVVSHGILLFLVFKRLGINGSILPISVQ